MKSVEKSIWGYGIYLVLMGSGLLFIPNLILQLFGFPATNEIWVRVLGVFTSTAGIYYLYASYFNQTAFYKATIIGRIYFFVLVTGIAFYFKTPLTLILVATVDVFGAIWTWFSLRGKR